ncbi:glycoside hydrolase family 13 protein [Bacillus marinisedimentorum]|uniref:glycoside hydrolase family 13 protein n=1 Tax=Bacillus marinisedimentorum TaxID=1821260 RepID=UPI0007E17058|nr:alpha-glucosidase [Bacillus marinisedimentorum]
MEPQWWKNSVVYQIYPKSFYDSNNDGIGDLPGIIEKLDYLKNLGIDLIWLSPVYQSPMDDNGYDISDYYAIAEQFGTMEDMEKVIEEAGRRNINIMMDLVVNHTSDEHEWFIESRSSKASEKRDWYIWKDPKHDGSPPNNWRSIFGGPAWEYDEKTNQYYLHVFSKKQPDLNWENQDVRQAVYGMVNWWLEKGIAGFRVDAITFIKKRADFSSLPADDNDGLVQVQEGSLNQPGIHPLLRELKEETFEKYEIVTVAEAPGVKASELPRFVGPEGHFNMLFEFDHVDLDLGKEGKWTRPVNWSLLDLKRTINQSQQVLNESGWGALYIENHDHPRSLNKFLREQGAGVKAQKMLAAMYFLLRGTPFIYQGQEIGMTNADYGSIDRYDDISTHNQYALAMRDGFSEKEALDAAGRRSRDHARTPMQWNDSKNAGFTEGVPWLDVNENVKEVNVQNALNDSDSLYFFYKRLISLRKDSPYSNCIVFGKYEQLDEDNPAVFAYKRFDHDKTIVVACNFTNEEEAVQIDLPVQNVILSNDVLSKTGQRPVKLKPYEAMVYEA